MMTEDCVIDVQGPLNFTWATSQKITVFQKSKSGPRSIFSTVLHEVQTFASAKKNVFLQRLIRASYGWYLYN